LSDAGNFLSDQDERVNNVRGAVPAMVRAFWNFPETVHLLPNDRNRRRVLPRYLAADMADAERFGGLQVAREGDQVIGAAAWLPPGAYPITLARELQQVFAFLPVLPWGIGAAREARRGQAANRAEHHRRSEPHYFLRAIGVDPDHQRRGVGRTLIAPMLERADEEHVGCFLFTATAANAAWYESLGFTESARYHPTPTWPEVWAMWRQRTG
jgi:GNAT superfamily N-acetyltransferase